MKRVNCSARQQGKRDKIGKRRHPDHVDPLIGLQTEEIPSHEHCHDVSGARDQSEPGADQEDGRRPLIAEHPRWPPGAQIAAAGGQAEQPTQQQTRDAKGD
jgi:hypothetical protein